MITYQFCTPLCVYTYIYIYIYIYILDKSLVHQVTTEKVFGAQTPPPNTVSEGVLELYGVYVYV